VQTLQKGARSHVRFVARELQFEKARVADGIQRGHQLAPIYRTMTDGQVLVGRSVVVVDVDVTQAAVQPMHDVCQRHAGHVGMANVQGDSQGWNPLQQQPQAAEVTAPGGEGVARRHVLKGHDDVLGCGRGTESLKRLALQVYHLTLEPWSVGGRWRWVHGDQARADLCGERNRPADLCQRRLAQVGVKRAELNPPDRGVDEVADRVPGAPGAQGLDHSRGYVRQGERAVQAQAGEAWRQLFQRTQPLTRLGRGRLDSKPERHRITP
jgi:hypothetical protein